MKTSFLFPRLCATAISMMWLWCGAAVFASEPLSPGTQVLWSIGKPDGRSIEFAPGSRSKVIYEVGKSVPSRDFPGHHSGSVDFDAKTNEKPYTITFDLKEPPSGSYQLMLDLIYKSGAPRQIEVMVNDRLGIFPVRHEPKKSGDGEEANLLLLAQQHLVVPIEGAWLKPERNRITIVPLGLGSLEYDALALLRGPAAAQGDVETLRLHPTIFFRKTKGKLAEVCELVVPFQNQFKNATASIRLENEKFTKTFNSSKYDFGVWTEPIDVPVSAFAGKAAVEVSLDGRTLTAAHEFAPSKQWRVFICPKVHNDVGEYARARRVVVLRNRK